jgi:uncharacterized protein YcgL (UPF0745 family)
MKIFAFHNKTYNTLYYIDIKQLTMFIDDNFPLKSLSSGFGCGSHSSWEHIGNFQYEDVETILTKEEFDTLANRIPITKEMVQTIIDKLDSDENKKLLNTIVDRELECLKEEYNLSDNDIDNIKNDLEFKEFYLDRNCICHIYDNYKELGQYIIDEFYDIPQNLQPYFKAEDLGYDVVNEDARYIVMDDKRIVEFYEI